MVALPLMFISLQLLRGPTALCPQMLCSPLPHPPRCACAASAHLPRCFLPLPSPQLRSKQGKAVLAGIDEGTTWGYVWKA